MLGTAGGAHDISVNKTDLVLNILRRQAMNQRVMKGTADTDKWNAFLTGWKGCRIHVGGQGPEGGSQWRPWDKDVSPAPSHHPPLAPGVGSHLSARALSPLLPGTNSTLPLYSFVKPGTITTKQYLHTSTWSSIYGHVSCFLVVSFHGQACFWTYLTWSEMDPKTTHDPLHLFSWRSYIISEQFHSHDAQLFWMECSLWIHLLFSAFVGHTYFSLTCAWCSQRAGQLLTGKTPVCSELTGGGKTGPQDLHPL